MVGTWAHALQKRKIRKRRTVTKRRPNVTVCMPIFLNLTLYFVMLYI